MKEWIRERQTPYKTVGDLIADRYPNYYILSGSQEQMNMDVSHGVDIEICDNSEFGRGVSVTIYPYVKYTDGSYRPYLYDSAYYIYMERSES